MKKSKNVYLLLIITIFIILWIPFFENVSSTNTLMFFGTAQTFTSIYPKLLFLWIVEWGLITLYINALLGNMKKEEPKKFDL